MDPRHAITLGTYQDLGRAGTRLGPALSDWRIELCPKDAKGPLRSRAWKDLWDSEAKGTPLERGQEGTHWSQGRGCGLGIRTVDRRKATN